MNVNQKAEFRLESKLPGTDFKLVNIQVGGLFGILDSDTRAHIRLKVIFI